MIAQNSNMSRPNKSRKLKNGFAGQKYFDKSKLPAVDVYYRAEFPSAVFKNKGTDKWQQVICCFHREHFPSLGINTGKGCFKCFSCGAKGGDIVAFHQLRYGMSFVEAVNFFDAWNIRKV